MGDKSIILLPIMDASKKTLVLFLLNYMNYHKAEFVFF